VSPGAEMQNIAEEMCSFHSERQLAEEVNVRSQCTQKRGVDPMWPPVASAGIKADMCTAVRDRKTGRQTDRQTDRQAGRQTDRQSPS